MSLKGTVQYNANIGHWYRRHDDSKAAQKRIDEDKKEAARKKQIDDAARKILESIGTRVQGCARRAESYSHVHMIPESDIDFPQGYFEPQPLPASTLKGVSKRVFEILTEEGLTPVIVTPRRCTFEIQIPVPPHDGAHHKLEEIVIPTN